MTDEETQRRMEDERWREYLEQREEKRVFWRKLKGLFLWTAVAGFVLQSIGESAKWIWRLITLR